MAFTYGRLTDFLNNAKAIDINQSLFFVLSMGDIQDLIISLNQDSQLFEHGIDGKGKKLSDIGGDYTEFTIEQKKVEGLPFNHVTLFHTGEFYDSYKVIPGLNGFILEANTIKNGKDLMDRWGNDILKLTDENMNILIEEILIELRKVIILQLFDF